jgi:hypothetical protein
MILPISFTEDIFDGAAGFSAERFGLGPFVFDGVEIRAVGGEIFEGMVGAGYGMLGVLSFVEGGVVHDDDASCGQLGQEILPDPGSEDIGIDSGAEQSDRKQATANQRADHVGAASDMPVVHAMTSLPCGRVAVRARHIVGKAAFIDVNNGSSCRRISGNLILEDVPCVRVRLGMPQRFFYRSPSAFSAQEISRSALRPNVARVRTDRHPDRQERPAARLQDRFCGGGTLAACDAHA